MTRAKPKTKPNGRAAKVIAPAKATSEKKDNVVVCDPPPPDELDKRVPFLKHLGGGKSDKWNQFLANQAINTGWFQQDISPEARAEQCKAILGFLAGVNPADTIEGMIAAQLFASHASAMECYRRAMLPGQSLEGKELLLTLAAKLTKANAAQVEALKKHRSNGQQKVIVEHVHVYPGGQAIVGNVTPWGVWQNYGGTSPCCWICEMLRDAVRKPARGRPANLRQCLTADAGCTEGRRRALRRAIKMHSSTGDIRQRRFYSVGRLRS